MRNNKGMSLLGMLIALTIIMTLTVIMIKSYQKSISTVTGKPQTPQQSIQELRKAVQEIEKNAAQRAELDPSVYR